MEIIKQTELRVGWTHIKPYACYLEFWKNKSGVELPQDCLFNISSYLGNICGLLNRDIRKKWLNIVGIDIYGNTIDTLPERLTSYVKVLHFGKRRSTKKKEILMIGKGDSGPIKFDAQKISKFKNINSVWFSPSVSSLYPMLRRVYLDDIVRLYKILSHNNPNIIDYYLYWDGGFRDEHQKGVLRNYVTQIFPEIIPEIRARLTMVNIHNSTRMTYSEAVSLYSLINKGIPDYILFSDIRSHLEALTEPESKNINMGIKKFTIEDRGKKINILMSYHPMLYEYFNSVIVPIYSSLGIMIETTVFGTDILPIYYNPSLTEGCNYSYSDHIIRDILTENNDSLSYDTDSVLNRFLHSEAGGNPETGGYGDIEEYQSSEINDIMETDKDMSIILDD